MKIYDELLWRGLIKDFSDPALIDKLNNGNMTFYIGTDPTGDSLHIGHFSSFLIASPISSLVWDFHSCIIYWLFHAQPLEPNI